MSTWMVLLIIGGIFIIGLVRLIVDKEYIVNRANFCHEYGTKFIDFCSKLQSNHFDSDGYIWLTSNVNKIQRELGVNGIMYNYHPPFANYIYPQYALLINTLPQLRTHEADTKEIFACQDVLIRHLGDLNETIDHYIKRLRNPLIWLREGITFLITFPFRLASWFGLLQYTSLITMSDSLLVKLISFIVSIIGLISSVMTVLLGQDEFLKILKSLPFINAIIK